MRRDAETLEKARELRREMTPPERALWSRIRGGLLSGVKFGRQMPIGPYIADFAVSREMLNFELYGDSHAFQVEHDRRRTAYLGSLGYRIPRFSNQEMDANLEGIAETVIRTVRPA